MDQRGVHRLSLLLISFAAEPVKLMIPDLAATHPFPVHSFFF
jgi:hypothetical protein